MPRLSSKTIRHNICIDELRTKGAIVYDYEGIVTFVSFVSDDFEVTYIYHSNPDNTYNLERFKPLVMDLGVFHAEEIVVDTISEDLAGFVNAAHSRNFETFLELDTKLSTLVSLFENLFINYNVDKEKLDELGAEIVDMQNHILDVKSASKQIYVKD